jgi:hypothetical protein
VISTECTDSKREKRQTVPTNDKFLARLFVTENAGRQFVDLLHEVRTWLAQKLGAARAEILIARAKGIPVSKEAEANSANWTEALARATHIAFYIRELSGMPEESKKEVADMSLEEYAAARKDLGVKDTHSYERSW